MNDLHMYLNVLGLDAGASPDDAHDAYRKLVKKWHPDRYANDMHLYAIATEKLKEINAAYAGIKSIFNDLGVQPFTQPDDEYSIFDFFSFVKGGNANAVARILKSHPLWVHATDDEGLTALFWAVIGKEQGLVALLLRSGADCNFRDSDQRSLLELALLQGYREIAEMLRRYGAQEPNSPPPSETVPINENADPPAGRRNLARIGGIASIAASLILALYVWHANAVPALKREPVVHGEISESAVNNHPATVASASVTPKVEWKKPVEVAVAPPVAQYELKKGLSDSELSPVADVPKEFLQEKHTQAVPNVEVSQALGQGGMTHPNKLPAVDADRIASEQWKAESAAIADAERGIKMQETSAAIKAELERDAKENELNYREAMINAKTAYLRFQKGEVAFGEVEKEVQHVLAIRPLDADALKLLSKPAANEGKQSVKPSDGAELVLNLGAGVHLELVRVEPGQFQMGENGSSVARVNKPFYIGKYPITVAQFRRFVAVSNFVTDAELHVKDAYTFVDYKFGKSPEANWKNPGFAQGDEHPVVLVSFEDAQAFVKWLASQTKRNVTMPTGIEWEYAARGPQSLTYPWGNSWDGTRANHADMALMNSGKEVDSWNCSKDNDGYAFTSPVGVLRNASWCGAYDMSGNVWQWCRDSIRNVRGGAWSVSSLDCRPAIAHAAPLGGRVLSSLGFRIVVTSGL